MHNHNRKITRQTTTGGNNGRAITSNVGVKRTFNQLEMMSSPSPSPRSANSNTPSPNTTFKMPPIPNSQNSIKSPTGSPTVGNAQQQVNRASPPVLGNTSYNVPSTPTTPASRAFVNPPRPPFTPSPPRPLAQSSEASNIQQFSPPVTSHQSGGTMNNSTGSGNNGNTKRPFVHVGPRLINQSGGQPPIPPVHLPPQRQVSAPSVQPPNNQSTMQRSYGTGKKRYFNPVPTPVAQPQNNAQPMSNVQTSAVPPPMTNQQGGAAIPRPFKMVPLPSVPPAHHQTSVNTGAAKPAIPPKPTTPPNRQFRAPVPTFKAGNIGHSASHLTTPRENRSAMDIDFSTPFSDLARAMEEEDKDVNDTKSASFSELSFMDSNSSINTEVITRPEDLLKKSEAWKHNYEILEQKKRELEEQLQIYKREIEITNRKFAEKEQNFEQKEREYNEKIQVLEQEHGRVRIQQQIEATEYSGHTILQKNQQRAHQVVHIQQISNNSMQIDEVRETPSSFPTKEKKRQKILITAHKESEDVRLINSDLIFPLIQNCKELFQVYNSANPSLSEILSILTQFLGTYISPAKMGSELEGNSEELGQIIQIALDVLSQLLRESSYLQNPKPEPTNFDQREQFQSHPSIRNPRIKVLSKDSSAAPENYHHVPFQSTVYNTNMIVDSKLIEPWLDFSELQEIEPVRPSYIHEIRLVSMLLDLLDTDFSKQQQFQLRSFQILRVIATIPDAGVKSSFARLLQFNFLKRYLDVSQDSDIEVMQLILNILPSLLDNQTCLDTIRNDPEVGKNMFAHLAAIIGASKVNATPETKLSMKHQAVKVILYLMVQSPDTYSLLVFQIEKQTDKNYLVPSVTVSLKNELDEIDFCEDDNLRRERIALIQDLIKLLTLFGRIIQKRTRHLAHIVKSIKYHLNLRRSASTDHGKEQFDFETDILHYL